MFLRQYEFKIEFYDYHMIKTKAGLEPARDKYNRPILRSDPRFIIECQNGAPFITFSTSHQYSKYSCLTSEVGTLRIYNLNTDFNNNIQLHWGVKIYCRYFSGGLLDNPYYLVSSGRIRNMEETDYDNGDFEIKYDISHLETVDNEFSKQLFDKPKQLKGKTIGYWIKEIYGDRAVSYLTNKESSVVIEKSMIVDSPSDFQYKISTGNPAYVTGIYQDMAPPGSKYDVVTIFMSKANIQDESKYKSLEDYGLIFIPQQQKQFEQEYNFGIIYWNCIILYTHEIRCGHKIKFIDSLGETRYCHVEKYTVNLSSSGDCVMNLTLYDEKINVIALAKASKALPKEEKTGIDKEVVREEKDITTKATESIPKEEPLDLMTTIKETFKESFKKAEDNISEFVNKSTADLKTSLDEGAKLAKDHIDWTSRNIHMLKIGEVESFDNDKQIGTVVIKDLKGVKIETKNISNFKLDLKRGDKVALMQAIINIFDSKDNVKYDKNHFYIIASIEPRHLSLTTSKVTIIAEDLEIDTKNKIKFENDVVTLRETLLQEVDNLESFLNSLERQIDFVGSAVNFTSISSPSTPEQQAQQLMFEFASSTVSSNPMLFTIKQVLGIIFKAPINAGRSSISDAKRKIESLLK